MRAAGRVGESAIGTCLLLTLLLVVSSVATYTTARAIFGSAASARDLSLPQVCSRLLTCHHLWRKISAPLTAHRVVQVISGTGGVDEDYCRGMEHVELWGDTVKSGSSNLQPTAGECCAQCK